MQYIQYTLSTPTQMRGRGRRQNYRQEQKMIVGACHREPVTTQKLGKPFKTGGETERLSMLVDGNGNTRRASVKSKLDDQIFFLFTAEIFERTPCMSSHPKSQRAHIIATRLR